MSFVNISDMLLQTLGGLGLFLLGMVIMTDNLRALAGSAIRMGLLKFTRTPLSGAVTGAISTAILQSSSAMTVAVVGFVGASLLAFPEALGIIFGANIGTTITGWLVALLGFKLQLGSIALPLVFIGISLRLFGKGKLVAAGMALAGFALIFVGISTMQQGMVSLQGIVSPADLPADTVIGRLQLVMLGVIFTVITQSSSAGIATTLAALYAGAINFHQAAALIIGMDIGTTITALLASIGASVGARRTGYSHVIYNFFTAVGALLLISPFVWLWEMLLASPVIENAEVALVAFHTTFNILGVIVVLPFTRQFAYLIERLVPEKVPFYTQKLEIALLQQPALALTEIQIVLEQEFIALLAHVEALLTHHRKGKMINLSEMQAAIDAIHAYIDKIHLSDEQSSEWNRLIELIHSLEHMERLLERCKEASYRKAIAFEHPQLENHNRLFVTTIESLTREMLHDNWTRALNVGATLQVELNKDYLNFRDEIIKQVGHGKLDIPQAHQVLETVRWMRRVSRHIEQITRHYVTSIEYIGT